MAILNNRYADGTDVSWIWDGHYEQMVDFPIQEVYTAGMRVKDMTKRLEVAGLDSERIHELASLEEVVAAIEASTTPHIHILATYTAMLDLRKLLVAKGYLKQ